MERGQDIAACAHCRQGGPYYLLLATNDYLPYYYLTVIPLPYLAQELPSAYLLLHLAKVVLSGLFILTTLPYPAQGGLFILTTLPYPSQGGPLHTYYLTLP